MSDKFDRYIEQGKRAIATHPDCEQLEIETLASDTIASVLHAVYGRKPLKEVMDDAYALLEQASRCFDGDYEDIEVES